jgi:hypothetical protein
MTQKQQLLVWWPGLQPEYSRAQPLVEERILVMRRMSDGLGSSKQEIEYFIISFFSYS